MNYTQMKEKIILEYTKSILEYSKDFVWHHFVQETSEVIGGGKWEYYDSNGNVIYPHFKLLENGDTEMKPFENRLILRDLLLQFQEECKELESMKWNKFIISVYADGSSAGDFIWTHEKVIADSEDFILWLYDAGCDFLSSKIENFAGEGLLYIDVKKGNNPQELKFSVEIDRKTQLFFLPITKIAFPEEAEQDYLQERFLNAFNLQFMEHVEGVLSKRWNRIVMRLNPIYWRGYDLNWERISFEYDEKLE